MYSFSSNFGNDWGLWFFPLTFVWHDQSQYRIFGLCFGHSCWWHLIKNWDCTDWNSNVRFFMELRHIHTSLLFQWICQLPVVFSQQMGFWCLLEPAKWYHKWWHMTTQLDLCCHCHFHSPICNLILDISLRHQQPCCFCPIYIWC